MHQTGQAGSRPSACKYYHLLLTLVKGETGWYTLAYEKQTGNYARILIQQGKRLDFYPGPYPRTLGTRHLHDYVLWQEREDEMKVLFDLIGIDWCKRVGSAYFLCYTNSEVMWGSVPLESHGWYLQIGRYGGHLLMRKG